MTDKPMNREQAEALAQEIVDAAFTEWTQATDGRPHEAFLRDRFMQVLMDADKAATERERESERERCAKIAEKYAEGEPAGYWPVGSQIANVIRESIND